MRVEAPGVGSRASERHEDTGLSVRQVFERSLARGDALFEEGDRADSVYVVQTGQIELTRGPDDGPRLLSRKGPGDLIGEMDVLLGSSRTASARALGDSRILELDAPTFEAMCVDQPEIAIRLIQQLATRVKSLERRLAAQGGDDLLRPVLRVLLRRAQPARGKSGTKALRRVPLGLRELASEAGLSLLETHGALAQLVERKLAKLVEDSLHVRDHETLAAALDPPDELAG